ncbi:uncharacterized protein V6R79_005153 [Siganus canaliculatus]
MTVVALYLCEHRGLEEKSPLRPILMKKNTIQWPPLSACEEEALLPHLHTAEESVYFDNTKTSALRSHPPLCDPPPSLPPCLLSSPEVCITVDEKA